MARFEVEHIVQYNINDIYNLIVDIEKYPEFLPWCTGAKIIGHKDNVIIADLVISFKIFTEHYRSQVVVIPPSNGSAEVNVSMLSGPFKRLENQWVLRQIKKNVTQINFMVDFKFKSVLLDSMIGVLFSKATEKMVEAFERRAEELYKAGYDGTGRSERNRRRVKKT